MNEVSTVSSDGVTVTSTSETPEQITAILSPSEDKPASDLSEAASRLGKEGGQASAKARAEQAKEKTVGAEEAAPEGATDAPEGEEKPLGKPRHDPRARMLEATREAAEAKRERDALKARVAELERAKAPETSQTEPKKATPADAPPKEEDFETYAEFVDARAEYKYNQLRKTERQQESQRAAAAEHGKALGNTVETFLERVSGVTKTDPQQAAKFAEFAATLSPNVQNLKCSFQRERDAQGRYTEPYAPLHTFADEIIGSERARDLMSYLSEHDDEYQRIAALTAAPSIVRAVARLEAKLEKADAAPTATAPKPQSNARPPLRPVDGTPHTAAGEPASDAPYEQHKAYWTRKDKESLAQR